MFDHRKWICSAICHSCQDKDLAKLENQCRNLIGESWLALVSDNTKHLGFFKAKLKCATDYNTKQNKEEKKDFQIFRFKLNRPLNDEK